MNRRAFIATGAGVGTGLLAGCAARDESRDGNGGDTGEHAGERESDASDGTGDDTEPDVGTFRFLVSDQPVAIDEFDSLNVSFSTVRIFRDDGAEDEAGDAEAEGDGQEETEESEERDEATEEEEDSEDDDEDPEGAETGDDEQEEPEDVGDDREADESDERRGFVEFDLGGAAVDLTTVVGDKATPILESELEEGAYSTIALETSDVEGVVDGERVSVKIPSERLRIVKPFEVRAGESLSFVFDINVVKKGPRDEYNLLPVIGESGVAGRDVEVEEIEPDEDAEPEDDENGEEAEDSEADEETENDETGEATDE